MAKAKSYLAFVQEPNMNGRKTKRFIVQNLEKQEVLGRILYHPHWRRYVFEPLYMPIFDATCLTEIVEKINELMAERKKR